MYWKRVAICLIIVGKMYSSRKNNQVSHCFLWACRLPSWVLKLANCWSNVILVEVKVIDVEIWQERQIKKIKNQRFSTFYFLQGLIFV